MRNSAGGTVQNPTDFCLHGPSISLVRSHSGLELLPWTLCVPKEKHIVPLSILIPHMEHRQSSTKWVSQRGFIPSIFEFGLVSVKGVGRKGTWADVHGKCDRALLLEAIQGRTGAHLISYCPDWQALLSPLSACGPPQRGRVGNYSKRMSTTILLHTKICINITFVF